MNISLRSRSIHRVEFKIPDVQLHESHAAYNITIHAVTSLIFVVQFFQQPAPPPTPRFTILPTLELLRSSHPPKLLLASW